MYPKTAQQARDYLKSMPDCDFVEFSIVGEYHGAIPYLYAKTIEGQWIIVWHPDELSD